MSGKKTLPELLKPFRRPLSLAVIILVMGLLKPDLFWTRSFFINMLLAVSIYGIMMCGTIFLLICGGIDLSVSTVAALAGTIVVKHVIAGGYTTRSVITGILIAVAVCQVIGFLHGLITTNTGISPLVVTLATKNIINAANQLYIENMTVPLNKPDLFNFLGGGKVLGIPMPIVVFALGIVLAYIVLDYTVFGKKVYAVGGNAKAAKFSGINTQFITTACFMISALTASVAGIVLASFNRQAVYFAASGYETNVLVALIVGGVAKDGGEGKITGAVFGVLLIGIINRSLILFGIDTVYHDIVRGALIIAAVATETYSKEKNNGLARRRTKRSNQPIRSE